MVLFDQLRISDDGQRMYINVHVNPAAYFDDIYLDSITIMTADKVSDIAPELFTEDYIYQTVLTGEVKEASLVLGPSDFNEKFTKTSLSKDLFFVYVKCKGVPDPCTPCRLDEMTTVGVTFDEELLHQRVMDYTKQLVGNCMVPQGFTDFILLWTAYKSAIETEHFIPAIKFYNLLFGIGDERVTRDGSNSPYGGVEGVLHSGRGCGCHG